MKKIVFISILALVFSLAFVPISNAQIAKEGMVTYTHSNTSIPLEPPLALDKERSAGVGGSLGVILSDNGKGPFHNMSTGGILMWMSDKGVMTLFGYNLWTDPDGDKVLQEIRMEPNEKPIGKLVGGTGKFAGIEGTVEPILPPEPINIKPSKEGTMPGTGKFKLHWKLP